MSLWGNSIKNKVFLSGKSLHKGGRERKQFVVESALNLNVMHIMDNLLKGCKNRRNPHPFR